MSDSDQPKPKTDPPVTSAPQNVTNGRKRPVPPRPKPDETIEFGTTPKWIDLVMFGALAFMCVCIGFVFLAMAWRIVTVGLK